MRITGNEYMRKIFGGNLGKLLGIDADKRRAGSNAVHDSLNNHAQQSEVNTPEKKTEASQMPENKYDVVISTPMGDMDGRVTLNIDGSNLSGMIFFMKNGKSIRVAP